MLSTVQMAIIIKALNIRIKNGEDASEAIVDYNRLTIEEKKKVLNEVKSQ